jgi:hypothetical protein
MTSKKEMNIVFFMVDNITHVVNSWISIISIFRRRALRQYLESYVNRATSCVRVCEVSTSVFQIMK